MEFLKKIDNLSKILIAICISLSIFTITVIVKPIDNEQTVETASSLSNEKIGWGIKRQNNHLQPDLGPTNKSLIEKYNGIAMGNNDEKNIYLTFDLGYEAGYTGKILDTLKEKNVQGTFFITAHYLNTASDLVERMINDGHIVGNQSPHTLMEL